MKKVHPYRPLSQDVKCLIDQYSLVDNIQVLSLRKMLVIIENLKPL